MPAAQTDRSLSVKWVACDHICLFGANMKIIDRLQMVGGSSVNRQRIICGSRTDHSQIISGSSAVRQQIANGGENVQSWFSSHSLEPTAAPERRSCCCQVLDSGVGATIGRRLQTSWVMYKKVLLIYKKTTIWSPQSDGCSGQDRFISNHESMHFLWYIQRQGSLRGERKRD